MTHCFQSSCTRFLYLINHVSAEAPTTGWMIPSDTSRSINPVIVTLPTGWMIPSDTSRSINPVIVTLTTGWMIPSDTSRSINPVIVIKM